MRNFTPKHFLGSGGCLIRMSKTELNCIKENKDFDGESKTSTLYCSLVKVGYCYSDTANFRVCLIDMSDGHVVTGNVDENYKKTLWESRINGAEAKQLLCDYLNDENTHEHRFATQEEVMRVILYQTARL